DSPPGPQKIRIIRRNYSIEQILDARDRITENLAAEFDTTLVGDQFYRVCQIVWESLTPSSRGSVKVHYPTLEDSLRCLLDQRLTRELARETAHRIAGNVQRLRERRPVPPWVAQHDHEW